MFSFLMSELCKNDHVFSFKELVFLTRHFNIHCCVICPCEYIAQFTQSPQRLLGALWNFCSYHQHSCEGSLCLVVHKAAHPLPEEQQLAGDTGNGSTFRTKAK